MDKRNALKLICKSAFVFFFYPFFITLKVASPSSVVNSNKCITVCEERGEIIDSESLLSKGINRASDRSRKKKVKFGGIFRDKFAEKSADFVVISREFMEQTSSKSNR